MVRMMRSANLIGTRTGAYLRVITERYRLIMTREWSGEIVERLRDAVR